tara:strand:+ start:2100 stop:2624 length:525 start_codon:yes stop_codon:yes gene_type:complete
MSTKAKELIKELGSKQMASDKLSQLENNDCVVRAVQHAFGVDYIDAHHFCEIKLHRVSGDGVYTSRYLPKVKQAFGQKVKMIGKPLFKGGTKRPLRKKKTKMEKWSNAKQKYCKVRRVVDVAYKVKEFVKDNSEGVFIVCVKGHAMALVNGKIIGNWNDGKRLNREVMTAYQVG